MHDPDNHLVLSNRAFCHFLLEQYEEALEDIASCVRSERAFCKGWFRRGLILEKLDQLGKAGVAYKTALRLSAFDAEQRAEEATAQRNLALCKSRFSKFMKRIKAEKKDEIASYISEFESSKARRERREKCKRISEQIREEAPHATSREDLVDIFAQDPRVCELEDERQLASDVQMSRYKECVAKNAFKFYNDANECNTWMVTWSSLFVALGNKRQFQVTMDIDQHAQMAAITSGVPTAEQVIRVLFETMTYVEILETGQVLTCAKPNVVVLSWRMRDIVRSVSKAMSRLGIRCKINHPMMSMSACDKKGTRSDGFNHLE